MNKRYINFYCNLSLLFFCNINGTQLQSLPSLLSCVWTIQYVSTKGCQRMKIIAAIRSVE